MDPEELARQLVAQLGSVEAARADLQRSSHPQARAVLAVLDRQQPAAPRVSSAPESEQNPIARAARFLGQGATAAGTAMMRANPVYSAGPLARIREDVEARHEAMKREPEGALENVSYYAGRLAPEALASYGAGKGVQALGIGSRLARAAISNIPSALTFGSSKEESLVQSDNPAVRIGAEYAANLAGEGVFAGAGRVLREVGRRRAAGRTLRELLASLDDVPPSETIAENVDPASRALQASGGPQPTKLDKVLSDLGISEVEPGTFKITDFPGMSPQEYLNRHPGGRLSSIARELVGKDFETEFQAARQGVDALRKAADKARGGAADALDQAADIADRNLNKRADEWAASLSDDFIRAEINVPKMTGGDTTLEPELFQAVRDAYAEFGPALKGKKRTFEAVRAAARDLDLEDLLDKKAETLTDAEALAIRNMGNRLMRDKQQLAKTMFDMNRPVEEREAAKQMFEVASLKLQKAVVQQLVGGAADARELGARRIMGKAAGDPLSWLAEATRTKGGRLNDVEQMKIYRLSEAYRNAKTPEEKKAASRALADAVGELNANVIDKIMYVRKGSLLQVPVTHLANIVSTAMELVIHKASQPATWVYDRIIGAGTGNAEVAFSLGRSLDIARRSEAGMGAGLKAGVRGAVDALRGNLDIESLSKMDLKKRVTFKNPLTRLYAFVSTEIPFRLLTAEDKFFVGIANRQAMIDRAILIARKAGYRGNEGAARVLNLLENPTDEMALAGIDASELEAARRMAARQAEDRTLRSRNVFTKGAGRVREGLDMISGGIAGQGFLTFTSTPTNAAIKGFNSTPLGFVSGVGEITGRVVIKAMKSAKGMEHTAIPREAQLRLAEKMGRSTTMAAPFVLGYMAAAAGIVTGGYPTTQSERDQWAAEGKTPYSILIGGKWRRLDRLQPFATPFVIGADVHRVVNDPNLDMMEKSLSSAAAQAQFVMESPFFTGTKELVETAGDLKNKISGTASRFAASFIPSAARATAYGLDPTIREPDGMAQQLQSRIPGMSQDLPARISNLGTELKRDGGLAGQYFDVLRSSPDRTTSDRLLRAMQEVGARTSVRDKRADESPEEYETRLRREGQYIRAEITAMIDQPWFRKLSKDDKRAEIMNEIERLKGQLTEAAK